jgi:hypothetical protein
MSYILAIELTSIENNNVTVEAVVDDMRCIFKGSHEDPAEYAPALCAASFTLDPDESIPVDEDGFCEYLARLDLDWQLVDASDRYLD